MFFINFLIFIIFIKLNQAAYNNNTDELLNNKKNIFSGKFIIIIIFLFNYKNFDKFL
jgi:hypothetical protein